MVLNGNEINKNTEYWNESSNQDLKVAQELFELKHYPQCLFFCHLSLEKLLKAIVVKNTKDYPPDTHDLRKLAEISGIKLDLEKEQILDKISTFNIAGRYADAKFKFYQEYNRETIAKEYLKITQGLILWLKKGFPKPQ